MKSRQSEINRNQSRQRLLRVAALITEGYDYAAACDKLGYRKDATSRAKQNFIRMGDKEITEAFRERIKLNDISIDFLCRIARGQDVGPSSRGHVDWSRQRVRRLGFVEAVGPNREWRLTDAGREFYDNMEVK